MNLNNKQKVAINKKKLINQINSKSSLIKYRMKIIKKYRARYKEIPANKKIIW